MRRSQPVGEKLDGGMYIMIARRVDGAPHEHNVGIEGGGILLRLPRFALDGFGDGIRYLSRVSRRAVIDYIDLHGTIVAWNRYEGDTFPCARRDFLAH
jgi:hypothetical protein